MSGINFSKISGSGNDFIVIDNRTHIFPDKNKILIQKLCAPHTGIGADGILLLEKSNRADLKMRIFNPDGSEPNMCGNGARCISLFAWKHRLIPKKFTIETLAGIIKAEVCLNNNIKIYLGNPKDIKLNTTVKLAKKRLKIHTINTGVPHAIIYVPNIDKVDVSTIGRIVRYAKVFLPGGTNVDFVQVLDKQHISVRTYERGVEAETLACGTGVTASAYISSLLYNLKSPVYIMTKSGDTLIVDTKEVSLTGPAKIIFKGIVNK